MRRIYISYNGGYRLIEEADILLYHKPNSKFSFGYWISKYTQSEYSHVGLAHWCPSKEWGSGNKDVLNGTKSNVDKSLFVIEQREFKGGRIAPLRWQVEHENEIIDVFRVNPQITNYTVINEKDKYHIVLNSKTFSQEIARNITKRAKSLILEHSRYSYSNVIKILKTYTPFFRLKVDKTQDEELTDSHVCSTLVNHAYRLEYCDLCPFIADEYTTPADVSRSSILHYVFTLTV